MAIITPKYEKSMKKNKYLFELFEGNIEEFVNAAPKPLSLYGRRLPFRPLA